MYGTAQMQLDTRGQSTCVFLHVARTLVCVHFLARHDNTIDPNGYKFGRYMT